MKSFIIAHSTIKDADKFMQYAKHAGESMTRFNGRIVQKGKVQSVLCGNHIFENVAIIEFPDQQSAQNWYQSSEYQALLELRDEAANVNFISYQTPA